MLFQNSVFNLLLISPYVSSFTAECTKILEFLIYISSFTVGNYLVVSNCQPILLAIIGNHLSSKYSPIILKINSFFLSFDSKFFFGSFLWASGHIGILWNERADSLAISTMNIFPSVYNLCPDFDVILIHRRFIYKLWMLDWTNLPLFCAANFKLISPNISP